MQIQNTRDYPKNTSLMLMVYGMGGVGKTTFAATFPKPLLIDFENGAKYFGERGIHVDVANQKDWFTNEDFQTLKSALDNYETIIVDPIGEAMQKLINTKAISGNKYRQGGTGDLTMAGWGEVKNRMRSFIKWLRDTNKNVVIVAHVDEKNDDERIVRRPMIATKLSDELITMVDIVAYMSTITETDDENNITTKRVLFLDPSDDKTVSKDRTGKLGKYVKPDYAYIANQLGYTAADKNQTAPQGETAPDSSENAPQTAPNTEKASTPDAPAKEPTVDEKVEMLEQLTVEQLKEKLKEKGLPTSGAKTILVMRLAQA